MSLAPDSLAGWQASWASFASLGRTVETSERKPWIVDRVASTSSEPLQSPPELQQAAGLSVNSVLPGELDRVSDSDPSALPRSKKPSVSYLPASNC